MSHALVAETRRRVHAVQPGVLHDDAMIPTSRQVIKGELKALRAAQRRKSFLKVKFEKLLGTAFVSAGHRIIGSRITRAPAHNSGGVSFVKPGAAARWFSSSSDYRQQCKGKSYIECAFVGSIRTPRRRGAMSEQRGDPRGCVRAYVPAPARCMGGSRSLIHI